MNALIDEINRQKPLSSASIAVEESPNGTLLKVTQTQQGGGGDTWPASVGWQQLAVIDTSSGTCVTKYIWYWGTPASDNPNFPSS